MAPDGPHILIFMCLCNPLPLCVGRTCDWLLANGTWQRWWECHSVITLCRTVTPILLANSLPRWLWQSKLPWWGGTLGKELRGSLACSQVGPEDLSPTAQWEQDPANSYINELQYGPFLSELTDRTQSCNYLIRAPKAEDPVKQGPDSWPPSTVR